MDARLRTHEPQREPKPSGDAGGEYAGVVRSDRMGIKMKPRRRATTELVEGFSGSGMVASEMENDLFEELRDDRISAIRNFRSLS